MSRVLDFIAKFSRAAARWLVYLEVAAEAITGAKKLQDRLTAAKPAQEEDPP